MLSHLYARYVESRDGKGEEERRTESTTMNGTNYRVAKKVQRRRSWLDGKLAVVQLSGKLTFCFT